MRNIFSSVRLSAALVAVVVLLIFLHILGVLQPVEAVLVKIFSPVQHRIYSVAANVTGLYTTVAGKNELVQATQVLQAQVEELTVQNAKLQTQLAEAEALLEQQDFLKDYDTVKTVARVIGQNPEANVRSMIIDRGSADGIVVGAPVVTGAGILVGKVSTVKQSSSEVILINDSRSRIAAVILNDTKTQGVVVGEHGLSLTMDLVPQNEIVQEGNIVVTAGIEPEVPRGLVVGTVSQVTAEPNNLFQAVRVRSLVDIDHLTVVTVLGTN